MHSRVDVDCRKRPRETREYAKAESVFYDWKIQKVPYGTETHYKKTHYNRKRSRTKSVATRITTPEISLNGMGEIHQILCILYRKRRE